MGVGFVIFFIFLLILAIIVFAYCVKLFKKGNKKSALFLVTCLTLFLVYIFNMNTIDAFTHTKSDVLTDLAIAKLVLKNDFEIMNNDVTGFPERMQKTSLKISYADAYRISNEIKDGDEYKTRYQTHILERTNWHNTNDTIKTTDYYFNGDYVRESYKKNNNYVPISMIVSLNVFGKTIEYERIED